MKLFLYAGAISFLLVTACRSSRGDAVAYNNKIANEQNKIIRLLLGLSDTTTGSKEVKRQRLEAQARESAAVVRKMPAFKGNTSLRNAAIQLFDQYVEAFSGDYKRLIILGDKGAAGTITDAETTEVQEIMERLRDIETRYERPLKTIQQDFAREYGFSVARNKYQDDIDRMKK